MEINEIMMKSHAKTYGSHGMVRVKIALSREPERALIRRLYGCMTSVEVESAWLCSVAWPAGVHDPAGAVGSARGARSSFFLLVPDRAARSRDPGKSRNPGDKH